jgi:hypothetical protein
MLLRRLIRLRRTEKIKQQHEHGSVECISRECCASSVFPVFSAMTNLYVQIPR